MGPIRVRYTGPPCSPPPRLQGIGDFGGDHVLVLTPKDMEDWRVDRWSHKGTIAVEGPVFGHSPIVFAYMDPAEVDGMSDEDVLMRGFKRWCARNAYLEVEV